MGNGVRSILLRVDVLRPHYLKPHRLHLLGIAISNSQGLWWICITVTPSRVLVRKIHLGKYASGESLASWMLLTWRMSLYKVWFRALVVYPIEQRIMKEIRFNKVLGSIVNSDVRDTQLHCSGVYVEVSDKADTWETSSRRTKEGTQ